MLRSKKSMLIVSIVVALIMWSYVVMVNNPIETTTVKDVPVKLLNAESLTQRGLILTNDEDFTINVKIEGKKSEIKKVKKDEITAEADLYGYGSGEHVLSVSVTVPSNVTYAGAGENKIKVSIEELVSVYKAVDVEVVGDLKAGTEIGAIKTQPQEVAVKGAKNAVESVASVKVRISADKLTRNETSNTLKAIAVNADGEAVKNVTLSAETIEVKSRLYYTKEVPLTVEITGSLKSSYTLNKISVPDSIVIKGTKEALSEISSLTARPVDISDVTASAKLPIYVSLPTDVEIAEASEDIHVFIDIKGKAQGSITYAGSDVELLNIPAGCTAYVNTAEITVTASGRVALINALSKESCKLSADLTNLAPGSHQVQLKLEPTSNYDSIEAEPNVVYVTINEDV